MFLIVFVYKHLFLIIFTTRKSRREYYFFDNMYIILNFLLFVCVCVIVKLFNFPG